MAISAPQEMCGVRFCAPLECFVQVDRHIQSRVTLRWAPCASAVHYCCVRLVFGVPADLLLRQHASDLQGRIALVGVGVPSLVVLPAMRAILAREAVLLP